MNNVKKCRGIAKKIAAPRAGGRCRCRRCDKPQVTILLLRRLGAAAHYVRKLTNRVLTDVGSECLAIGQVQLRATES